MASRALPLSIPSRVRQDSLTSLHDDGVDPPHISA